MHFGAQLLQPLLVPNAEMLLLVDDDEAEILKADSLAQDRVSPNNDVDPAFGKALLTSRLSAAPTMRESWPTLTGRPAKRWRKFCAC